MSICYTTTPRRHKQLRQAWKPLAQEDYQSGLKSQKRVKYWKDIDRPPESIPSI
jgi:hypothetical protein